MILPCVVDGYTAIFNYELLTFLHNFETKEYLNYLIHTEIPVYIDIGSNIGRLSWIYIKHNKHAKTVALCDANPTVF
ncbi:MAG: hypothetical protein LBG59_04510 [Candidatus Peribacteria bacterium]|nr:hypothetical protein [Candidatus Peribacteria bacterium]